MVDIAVVVKVTTNSNTTPKSGIFKSQIRYLGLILDLKT